jgi:hypothetical protein
VYYDPNIRKFFYKNGGIMREVCIPCPTVIQQYVPPQVVPPPFVLPPPVVGQFIGGLVPLVPGELGVTITPIPVITPLILPLAGNITTIGDVWLSGSSIVVPSDGLYEISYSFSVAANQLVIQGTVWVDCLITNNGNTIVESISYTSVPSNSNVEVSRTFMAQLKTGDLLQVSLQATSDGPFLSDTYQQGNVQQVKPPFLLDIKKIQV